MTLCAWTIFLKVYCHISRHKLKALYSQTFEDAYYIALQMEANTPLSLIHDLCLTNIREIINLASTKAWK